MFKGRDNYVAVGPAGTPVTPEDKVTKDFYGLAVNFTPTKYQVFPGADLSMPISYSHGLSGNSAVLLGGNEGAGSYSVGVALDLQSKYRFDLKYVDFTGRHHDQPRQRDHLQRRRQLAAHRSRLRGLHLQDHPVTVAPDIAKEHTMNIRQDTPGRRTAGRPRHRPGGGQRRKKPRSSAPT